MMKISSQSQAQFQFWHLPMLHSCYHWQHLRHVLLLEAIFRIKLQEKLLLVGESLKCIFNDIIYHLVFFRYWWIYGVNFLIYLVYSQRIRSAYKKFLNDMISPLKSWCGIIETNSSSRRQSSAWGVNINLSWSRQPNSLKST